MTKGLLAARVGAWPASSTQMTIQGPKLANDYCIDEIDPDATLDWRALERYPALVDLTYEGRDKTLIAWLAKRRHITTLYWMIEGLTGTFDLARTHLRAVAIRATTAMTLKLPRSVTSLSLSGYANDQAVRIEGGGARLALQVWMQSKHAPVLPRGVSKITRLAIDGARVVSLASLVGCRAIEELEITGDPAVSIPDPELLARFAKLRELSLVGVYDLDGARVPRIPTLASLEIRGITKEAAAAIRKTYAGTETAIAITGVKSAAWLAENLANPFRDWGDEYSARIARVAKQAWQAATARMAKLGARASGAAVQGALAPFVAAFNRIEPDIDTLMREEIYEAFGALVPARHAANVERWFDAKRDF